jgi:hypothetical protein
MPHKNLPFPVDGHVHFHRREAVGLTLDAAARNFQATSSRTEALLGAVLLTQTATERVFEKLRDSSSTVDAWSFTTPPDEPETLIAARGVDRIAVVCGRQVRASDGLEVLALGTLESFPDGLAFDEAIRAVLASGALTVLPWGFGKWLGERGQRVERALAEFGPEVLMVGDNGSRLTLAGVPPLVQSAALQGFRVLPGTDPFPFAAGHRRVGKFGFLATCEPPESAPWRALRGWLEGQRQSPQPYGRATGPFAFLFNQVGIQVYNRFFRSPAA